MGKKNDVWSSQSALGLRRTGNSSLGPACSYRGRSLASSIVLCVQNLKGALPISTKHYPG